MKKQEQVTYSPDEGGKVAPRSVLVKHLQCGCIGSCKGHPVENSAKSRKPHLKRDVQRVINWMDGNVLPLIALVLLSGLAVQGLKDFIPEMNETTQTVASILAVTVLVVKLKSSRV